MEELFWARSQMAFSLGFHIIFASISMVMPFYMALSHRLYLRHGKEAHLRLTRAWSKGTAVLFATGAVTGTVLSFQLGLLWPGFMVHAGPIIGMPFSLEGAAFFLEAIFLGLFLYGWNRLSPRVHWWCGVMVGVCGFASGILVVAANGWMNSPSGFCWTDEGAVDIEPWAAMFNDAWLLQAAHMQVAALQAVGFAVAGMHALAWLRGRNIAFHKEALRIVLPLAMAASLLQPLIGDFSAKAVAHRQPEKFAALEAHFHTERRASLLVGGIPDAETGSVSWGVHIPGALSFLAHSDFDAEVTGLDAFPREDRPPVVITHFAFQIMVAIGTLLAAVGAFWFWARWRHPRWLESPRFLRLLVVLTPLGFLALEAGWVVTEVGRQPWILYRVLRTADSVTPVPGLAVMFWMVVALYLSLGALSLSLLWRLFRSEERNGARLNGAEAHPTQRASADGRGQEEPA